MNAEQNDGHSTDVILSDYFRCVCVFYPKFTEVCLQEFNWQIDITVKIMASCWAGNKPLPEPMFNMVIEAIWRH